MTDTAAKLKINRTPVLTLWASVVAERLGFDQAKSHTLGQAVAGLSAYAKGVSLGIIEPSPDAVRERSDQLAEGESLRVDLLGRAVPVVRMPEGIRAMNKGKPGKPAQIEKYLAGKFGDQLEAVRAAMADLVAGCEPEDLYRLGFRLYEEFRPSVPAGESGWGAKGELDLEAIRKLQRQ